MDNLWRVSNCEVIGLIIRNPMCKIKGARVSMEWIEDFSINNFIFIYVGHPMDYE